MLKNDRKVNYSLPNIDSYNNNIGKYWEVDFQTPLPFTKRLLTNRFRIQKNTTVF